jgi:hypothetical protein
MVLIFYFVFLFVLIVVFACMVVAINRSQGTYIAEYKGGRFGSIKLYKRPDGEVWIHMGGTTQGVDANTFAREGSYWHKIRDVILSFRRVILSDSDFCVLHLGLGGATIPMLVALEDSKVKQTILEIEPKLIDVVLHDFKVEEVPSIEILQGDAFDYVENLKSFGKKFDVVVVDVFSDYHSLNSPKSSNIEFISYYKSVLKEHGMIVFNHPSHSKKSRESASDFMKLLDEILGDFEWEEVDDKKRHFVNRVIWKKF